MMRFVTIAAALAVAGCTGKYIRETTADKIDATPERLARGAYIVNNIGACGGCHTTRDGATKMEDFVTMGESTTGYLAGGNDFVIEGMGQFTIPNLTPDMETGIGGWTDDEIMRAVRDGVNRHGDLMFPMMPFNQYQHMSDEDVKSIVAYLRSVPAIKQPKPRLETDVGFMGNLMLGTFGVAHHVAVKSVPQPDMTDKIAYGKYVMRLGHCAECHSSSSMQPRAEDDPLYMGGDVEADPILENIVGKIYMRNLTPDVETGLGKYTAEQIKTAIRTSKRLDGKMMAPPMSIFVPHYSTASDEDLDALVAYLKSLKPAKNAIPERALNPEWEKKLSAAN